MSATQNVIENAIWFAYAAHGGQFRKYLPEPYIMHPVRVLQAAMRHQLGFDAMVVAVLHDVVEDCDVEIDTMPWKKLGGAPVRDRVKLLTKWWSGLDPQAAEFKKEYYQAIAGDHLATALKVIDRTDNLNDLVRVLATNLTAEKLRWAETYVSKSQTEIIPLAGQLMKNFAPAIGEEFFEALGAAQAAVSVANLYA